MFAEPLGCFVHNLKVEAAMAHHRIAFASLSLQLPIASHF